MFIFSFSEFQALIIMEIHLNHCKDSPCVFNFSFFSFLLFTGVLHGGSTWWFIKDLISSQSFHQDSFLGSSSFLHMVIRSAILSTIFWRWYYVILDNLSSCFMIHMLLRMRYFKSINLFVGVILCHISPKSLPLGMLLFVVLANDPSYLFIILVEEVFISSLISSKQLFPLVAGCHLIILRCFP